MNQPEELMVKNLAMMIRVMAHRLSLPNVANLNNAQMSKRAIDLLLKYDLYGSPLR